ncbi:MAG: hypothetical protein K2H85_06210 [Allobaculum sp.]|nr:hypothetical protein [Allobaculum sp.]
MRYKTVTDSQGKEIRFGASANTPFLYMSKTGRDINKDLNVMFKIAQRSQEEIPFSIEDLKMFSDIAYVMAYQGAEDKSKFPPTVEEWLDELDAVFSIITLLPVIFELWGINQAQTVETKKNLAKLQEK